MLLVSCQSSSIGLLNLTHKEQKSLTDRDLCNPWSMSWNLPFVLSLHFLPFCCCRWGRNSSQSSQAASGYTYRVKGDGKRFQPG